MILSDKQIRNLDCFYWLPLERWTADQLFNFYMIEGKQMCKLCDEWVPFRALDAHVAVHVAEKKVQIVLAGIEANKNRQEALALARAEKKRLKELGIQ